MQEKRWIGPYFITAEGYGYTYELRRRDDGQDLRAIVHSNRLRPFNESRDLFYARNPPSTSTDTSSTQISTNTSDTSTPDTGLGDGWYEINSYQPPNDGRKPHFLVHWKAGTKHTNQTKMYPTMPRLNTTHGARRNANRNVVCDEPKRAPRMPVPEQNSIFLFRPAPLNWPPNSCL